MKPNLTGDLRQSIKYLLQDKYHFSPLTILSYLEGKEVPLPQEAQSDLKHLYEGEPVSYLIGFIKFLGCDIDLSHRPLIPRPETEYWVEQVIKKQDPKKPLRILDLCCGSGCIGISILKHLPQSQVDFVDIDKNIIDQTKINLQLNNLLTDRYQLFQSDLFDNLPSSRYDLILANPPYVNEKGYVGEELIYEPPLALFASDSGLHYLKQILLSASKYLNPAGYLYSEFGDDQENTLRVFCQVNGLSVEFFKDQFGANRYLCLTPLPKGF